MQKQSCPSYHQGWWSSVSACLDQSSDLWLGFWRGTICYKGIFIGLNKLTPTAGCVILRTKLRSICWRSAVSLAESDHPFLVDVILAKTKWVWLRLLACYALLRRLLVFWSDRQPNPKEGSTMGLFEPGLSACGLTATLPNQLSSSSSSVVCWHTGAWDRK